ncbi:sterile alpha motif domain-containing protein 9-like isoform X2 [Branchiostoma floridae x Branchiostoma japonicum]
MGVDLGTYRARIGCFCNPGCDTCWMETSRLLVWAAISQLMLKLAGDVEENPGPGWWSWIRSWWTGDTDAEEKKPPPRSTKSKSRRRKRHNQSTSTSTAQKNTGHLKQRRSTPPRPEDDTCKSCKWDEVKAKVEPEDVSSINLDWLSSWQVEDVTNWMKRIGLKNEDIQVLRQVKIDGSLLQKYNIETLRYDLREIGHSLPPGIIRKIINSRDDMIREGSMGKGDIVKSQSTDTEAGLLFGQTVKLSHTQGMESSRDSNNDIGTLIPHRSEQGASQGIPAEINPVVRSKQRLDPIVWPSLHGTNNLDQENESAGGSTQTSSMSVRGTNGMSRSSAKPIPENFRQFDKEVDCNYYAGRFFPSGESGADGPHISHEYKLFTEAVKQTEAKMKAKYLSETLRFACGCLNERTNGTIHFGVSDHGEIVGVEISSTQIQKYCDWLSDAKEKMFEISLQQREAAKHCIRQPKFVPVARNGGQDLHVLEVDVVPSSEYCKNVMFKVALPFEDGNKAKPAAFRRVRAATEKLCNTKEEKEFIGFLPGIVENLKKREQSKAKGLRSVDTLDKADELIKLLCAGGNTLEGFVHRILVANGIEEPKLTLEAFRDLYYFVADIPFTAVFDFDAESPLNGLHKMYYDLTEEREDSTSNIRTLEPDSFSKKTSMTALDFYTDVNFPKDLCWIMSNGWIDSDGTNERPMDLTTWTEFRGRGIIDAMIKYTDAGMIQEGRVVIVFLLLSKSDIDIMAELFYYFCMRLGLSSIMILTTNEQTLNAWLGAVRHKYRREDLCHRAIVMPPKHIGFVVSQLKGTSYGRKCFVKCSTGANAHLDCKTKKTMQDLDILSVNQCTDTITEIQGDREAIDKLKTESELNFYRGNKVEWWNFFFDQTAKRDVYDTLDRHINNALAGSQGRKISVITIHHQPGAGGSTLAMNALWEFRNKRCRCVIINKSQPDWDTATQLMKLYAYKEDDLQKCIPVLALVEDVDEDAFYDFLSTLSCVFGRRETAQPSCIVLYCGQTEITSQESNPQSVYLGLKLSVREQEWFRTKSQQLEARSVPDISLDDMMSFNLFKEGFNESYVRRTVSKYLEQVTPKERELIGYIALLNVFLVNTSLPAPLCDNFMPGGQKWEWKLSEAAKVLLLKVQASKSSIGAYRVKHPKIAEETLNQARNSGESLSEMTHNFLKCSMFKERTFAVKELMEMMDKIFKHRPWKQRSQLTERAKKKTLDADAKDDGNEYQEAFSPLVQKIIDCEKHEAVVKVLKTWCEVKNNIQRTLYPRMVHEDPTIWQQIARVYLYAKRYADAHHWADEAISSTMKESSYLLDTKGHIYKAEFVAQKDKGNYDRQKVTEIAFKATEIFRRAQDINKKEMGGFNSAPYFGELFVSFKLFGLVYHSTSRDSVMLRKFLLTGKDPPRFVLDVWGTYTEQLRRLVLNIRNTMDYLSEIQTIYKEDDEIAIYDSEFRKLQLAKRKLQEYIEQYIRYFGEYDEKPPSYIRLPEDVCNWRRRKVISLGGNNFRRVFQMARDHEYETLSEIKDLLYDNIPKTCFDLHNLIAVSLALARVESIEESIASYKRVIKLSEEFVQVEHDHEISRLKAFFYVVMFMWPRKEMVTEFNLSTFEHYIKELSEMGKSSLFRRVNRHGGNVSDFRLNKKVYFYLGRGQGLHAFIHATQISGDQRGKGTFPFWEFPLAKGLLRRLNGRLIEHDTIDAVNPFNPNKPIRIHLARPETEKFVDRRAVNFILAFSWSGPLAFNVLNGHVQEDSDYVHMPQSTISPPQKGKPPCTPDKKDAAGTTGQTRDDSKPKHSDLLFSDACKGQSSASSIATKIGGLSLAKTKQATCPQCRTIYTIKSHFTYFSCNTCKTKFSTR